MRTLVVAAFIILPFLAWVSSQAPNNVSDAGSLLTFDMPRMYSSSLYPYHDSFTSLWDNYFSITIQRKAYPVDDFAQIEDFQPIFQSLAQKYPNTAPSTCADDDWAEPFFNPADKAYQIAEQLSADKNATAAVQAYMRAAVIYRIAYFPWVHSLTSDSALKKIAWQKEKQAFEKAQSLRSEIDFENTTISFTSTNETDEEGATIPAYVFRSTNVSDTESSQPVVVIVTGLDHYPTGVIRYVDSLIECGYSVVVVCMPGTGDSPITGHDPNADKAYWKAIVDWIQDNSSLYDVDNIYFWGLSTGGYWAIKISRYEKDRIKKVVASGGASHYTFTSEWLQAAETLAYPLSLSKALGSAFGYSNVTEFINNVTQYSLLNQGLLDQDSTFVLAVDGTEDTVFPIDDQMILTQHGPGAMVRWFSGQGHLGEPASNPWIFDWWKQLVS